MRIPPVTQLRAALQRLSACPETDILLTTLLREARDLLHGDVGFAWLATDAEQFRLQQTIGVTGATPSRLQRLTLPHGGERAAAQRLRYLGHRSVLIAPLRIRNQPAGLVAICSRRRRGFRRTDSEILRLLSHHAGVVIDSPGFRASSHRSTEENSNSAARLEIFPLLSPLISGITHNLNNTLAVIGGHIELMLLQPQPPSALHHLGASLQGVQQAGIVIRNLRDLPSVHGWVRHGPFDVNQVVHDCVELARSTWFMESTPQHSPVYLAVDLHPVPPLTGCAPDMKVALLLLLRHLMEVTRPGHTLTLRTWTDRQDGRQEVFLELADEPGGVHIGEPGGGLEPAFRDEQSARMELVPRLVHEIVGRLGGRIVMSGADFRMVFTVALTAPQTSGAT
jgi:signal transduction histidine kinase